MPILVVLHATGHGIADLNRSSAMERFWIPTPSASQPLTTSYTEQLAFLMLRLPFHRSLEFAGAVGTLCEGFGRLNASCARDAAFDPILSVVSMPAARQLRVRCDCSLGTRSGFGGTGRRPMEAQ